MKEYKYSVESPASQVNCLIIRTYILNTVRTKEWTLQYFTIIINKFFFARLSISG